MYYKRCSRRVPSCFLIAFCQELLPAFVDDWRFARRQEIVEAATNDVSSRKTQKVTPADTGPLIVSIIVGVEAWRRRVEDDGAEKGLELAGSVFGREENLPRWLERRDSSGSRGGGEFIFWVSGVG